MQSKQLSDRVPLVRGLRQKKQRRSGKETENP